MKAIRFFAIINSILFVSICLSAEQPQLYAKVVLKGDIQTDGYGGLEGGAVTITAKSKTYTCHWRENLPVGSLCVIDLPIETKNFRIGIKRRGFKSVSRNIMNVSLRRGRNIIDIGPIPLRLLTLEEKAKAHGLLGPMDGPIVNVNLPAQENPESDLRILRIVEGPPADRASRTFEVTIINSGAQRAIKNFAVSWMYKNSSLFFVDSGVAITPVAEYIIELPIDPDSGRIILQKFQPLSPLIVLPAGTKDAPSVVTLRLQLHYYFMGRINWHPTHGWDIVFSIDLVDDQDQRIPAFRNTSWRRGKRMDPPTPLGDIEP